MMYDLFEGVLIHMRNGGLTMVPLLLTSFLMWFLIIRSFIDHLGKDKYRGDCLESTLKGISAGSCRQSMIAMEYLHAQRGDGDSFLVDSLIRRYAQSRETAPLSILMAASMAPLMGLLGTVTGMIGTFGTITRFGTGNAKALALGISEALITTQSGLVIAVPGLIIGGLFLAASQRREAQIHAFCLGLPGAVASLLQPEQDNVVGDVVFNKAGFGIISRDQQILKRSALGRS